MILMMSDIFLLVQKKLCLSIPMNYTSRNSYMYFVYVYRNQELLPTHYQSQKQPNNRSKNHIGNRPWWLIPFCRISFRPRLRRIACVCRWAAAKELSAPLPCSAGCAPRQHRKLPCEQAESAG